jgi:hypothetical protein
MSDRLRLPSRRPVITSRLADPITGHHWHFTTGFDRFGHVREIFLDSSGRAGAPFDALIHDMCIVVSRDCLQRGLSPRELLRNLSERPPSLLAAAFHAATDLETELGLEMARLIIRENQLGQINPTGSLSAE